jgi:hypothetical protein
MFYFRHEFLFFFSIFLFSISKFEGVLCVSLFADVLYYMLFVTMLICSKHTPDQSNLNVILTNLLGKTTIQVGALTVFLFALEQKNYSSPHTHWKVCKADYSVERNKKKLLGKLNCTQSQQDFLFAKNNNKQHSNNHFISVTCVE